VPKFGMNVPHLRCDSHISFKVKRSKVRVTDGRGIPCRPNPAATLHVECMKSPDRLLFSYLCLFPWLYPTVQSLTQCVMSLILSCTAVQHERESRYIRYKRDGYDVSHVGDTKLIDSTAFDECRFIIIAITTS